MRPGAARAALGALVASAIAFSWLYVGQRYWCDDSFISFRYARNLISGLGLVYNAGERVEGYTNFLWTMLSAVPQLLGTAPIHFAQIVSLAAQAVTLWLVYRLGCAALPPGRALLAPLLLAGQVSFLAYPMTGMETSFFAMLVTLAFTLQHREAWRTPRGSLAFGAVLLALILTRFDGFVPVLLLVGYPVLRHRTLRPLLPALGLVAAGLLVYNLWRVSFYPTWLPNSVLAKTSLSPGRMVEGARYVAGFFLEYRLPLLLLAGVGLLGRGRSAAWGVGWMAAGLGGYAAAAGGDWMPLHRFLLPALPFLALLAQDGFWALRDRWRPAAQRGKAATAIAIALLAALNVLPVYRHRDFGEMTARHFQLEDAVRIGRYLDENVPADHLFAIEWGGIIPFHARQPVLETFGLADREIVQLPVRRTVWGRRLTPAYLAGRGPDLVITCARLFPTAQRARHATEPDGPADYGYYMELVRQGLGYEVQVFRIGEDEFWPGLVRTGGTAP